MVVIAVVVGGGGAFGTGVAALLRRHSLTPCTPVPTTHQTTTTTNTNTKKQKRRHAALEFVPIDAAAMAKAPLYFKKAMEESESEWSTHHA